MRISDWSSDVCSSDLDGSFLARFDAKLNAAIAGHAGAQYWNADREWVAPPAAFVDAIHLRWSAVQGFSVALAEQLQEARQELVSKQGLARKNTEERSAGKEVGGQWSVRWPAATRKKT